MSYYPTPGAPYVPQQPVNPYGCMGTVGLATPLPNTQMQQAQPHVFVQPHRPRGGDLRRDQPPQRRHGAAGTGARIRARITKASPTTTIGSDRSCPMVTPQTGPPSTWPSGLSGVMNWASA